MVSSFDIDGLEPVRIPKGSTSEDSWFRLEDAEVFLHFPDDGCGVVVAADVDHNEAAESQGVLLEKEDMLVLASFLTECAKILG